MFSWPMSFCGSLAEGEDLTKRERYLVADGDSGHSLS